MFKLFIYALFLYVLYRLLTGGRKKKPAGPGGSNCQEAGELVADDQLVEDPVCHIYIPKRQAIVLHDMDTPVFFCSEHCRKMYCDARETHRQKNG